MTFVCIHLLLGLSYIKLKNLNLLCSYTESRAYNMIWKNHNLILYDTLFLYLWNHFLSRNFRWQKALDWHIYNIKQTTEYVNYCLKEGKCQLFIIVCMLSWGQSFLPTCNTLYNGPKSHETKYIVCIYNVL